MIKSALDGFATVHNALKGTGKLMEKVALCDKDVLPNIEPVDIVFPSVDSGVCPSTE